MDRHALISELLDELSSHSPAEAMRAMRHWPGGRLSLVHLNVLVLLDADGAMPMRSLAEAMDVSQASTTGIVDRMEQRGLVLRQRDDGDRRVVHVAITDEGRSLVAGMAARRRDHMAQVLGELTDDELAGFLAGTRAMRRARDRFHAAMASGATDTAGTARAADPASAAHPARAAYPADRSTRDAHPSPEAAR